MKILLTFAFLFYAIGSLFSASANQPNTDAEMSAIRAIGLARIERSHGECAYVIRFSDEPSAVAKCADGSVWSFDHNVPAWDVWDGCRIIVPARLVYWRVSFDLTECYATKGMESEHGR